MLGVWFTFLLYHLNTTLILLLLLSLRPLALHYLFLLVI
jgi:hypothetical protein